MQTVSLGVAFTFIEVYRVVHGHGWVQSCQAAGQGGTKRIIVAGAGLMGACTAEKNKTGHACIA